MMVGETQKFPLLELLLFSRPRFNLGRVTTKVPGQDQPPLSKTNWKKKALARHCPFSTNKQVSS